MKKICCLLYSLFLLLNSSFAQNPLVKQWDKRFGGTLYEYLFSMQQTADGGYILGGTSGSGIGADKTQASNGGADYWIVKIDALGNKQWDKDFGGTDQDELFSLQQTTDGGYILGGWSFSGFGGDKTQGSKGGYDYWIVKIDSLGTKQWDKDFGGTNDDRLYSLQQAADGGYILGGYSNSGIGGDKTKASWPGGVGGYDYWIVKIDSFGNKQWDKDFGGTNDDALFSLQQTTDGGYMLGGSSYSGIGGDKTQASKGNSDYWIVKIDSLGNKQWDKDFGGTDDDGLYSLQQTPEGGYILGGRSLSGIGADKTQAGKGGYDFWIVKIDSLGDKQWDKDFGGISDEEGFGSIAQTGDGGYLIAGTSYSPISGDKTENNLSQEQTWIVKTDSLGNKQWDKTLQTNIPLDDEIGFAIQTKDGCYAMANFTFGGVGGDKTQPSQGSADYWIIKFCDTTNLSVIPPRSVFLASDTALCANDCISFTNQSSNATRYQWYFAGGMPSSSTVQNPYVCYQTSGSYDVKLVAANSGGKDSVTLSSYIRVIPAPPTPSITQVGTLLYCSTDPTYTGYQWYDSTVLIPGATDTLLMISHSGNYNVQVSNSDSCKIAGGINVTIGITPYLMNSTFSIFPNPLTSSAILQFNKQLTDAEVVIYDVMGKEVIRRKMNGNRMEIEKGNLASGVYFVSARDKERRYIQRIIVE